MNKQRHSRILRLLSLICLISVLAGCAPASTTPTSTAPAQTPTPIKLELEDVMENQLIVWGPELAVQTAIDNYNHKNICPPTSAPTATLTPCHHPLGEPKIQTDSGDLKMDKIGLVNPIQLTNINQANKTKAKFTPPFSNFELETAIIEVFDHPDPISTLSEHALELSSYGEKVYAEPNFINSAADACTHPHSGGESPFGTLVKPIPDSAFPKQWAFTKMGVPDTGGDPQAGAGVTIALLDSSPYKGFDGFTDYSLPLPDGFHVRIEDSIKKYGGYEFPHKYRHEIVDHGWFEAGLIHWIAPGARIYLFRTFDDYGCGNLGLIGITMIKALKELRDPKPQGEGIDGPIILSASFGANFRPGANYLSADMQKLPKDIALFQTALQEVYMHNALMVAAAGNDSASSAQPMEYPANEDLVIGVSASTKDDELSCFSNQGDVTAPGGQGLLGTTPNCQSATGNWHSPSLPQQCHTDGAECPNILVGPATISPTGFGALAGTSMATAEVSGVMAIALQTADLDIGRAFCMLSHPPKGPGPNPDLGIGIINVGWATSIPIECLPTPKTPTPNP